MRNALDLTRVVNVLAPDSDALAGTKTTTPIDLRKVGDFHFILSIGVGATGTQTITLEQCTASDGTGATAIPFKYRVSTDDGDTYGDVVDVAAAGFTTVAGSNKVYHIWADVDGKIASTPSAPYVRLKSVEVVDSPCDAAVLAVVNNIPKPPFEGTVF